MVLEIRYRCGHSQSVVYGPPPMSEAPDSTRTAGRGVVYITAAKLYFMVAGYVVQFVLPRLLGSAAAYGAYSTVMRSASIMNNVLVTGTIQSV